MQGDSFERLDFMEREIALRVYGQHILRMQFSAMIMVKLGKPVRLFQRMVPVKQLWLSSLMGRSITTLADTGLPKEKILDGDGWHAAAIQQRRGKRQIYVRCYLMGHKTRIMGAWGGWFVCRFRAEMCSFTAIATMNHRVAMERSGLALMEANIGL